MQKRCWTIKIIEENGELILPLPDDLITELSWEIGDEIEFQKIDSEKVELINQSMKRLHATQFRRRLNSIFRKLYTDSDPLRRVLITKRTKTGEKIRACILSKQKS